jgi:hypothetical protein
VYWLLLNITLKRASVKCQLQLQIARKGETIDASSNHTYVHTNQIRESIKYISRISVYFRIKKDYNSDTADPNDDKFRNKKITWNTKETKYFLTLTIVIFHIRRFGNWLCLRHQVAGDSLDRDSLFPTGPHA